MAKFTNRWNTVNAQYLSALFSSSFPSFKCQAWKKYLTLRTYLFPSKLNVSNTFIQKCGGKQFLYDQRLLTQFKSRPGLKARLLTVVDSRSQLIVLDTLVLKFPSNLKQQKGSNIYLAIIQSRKQTKVNSSNTVYRIGQLMNSKNYNLNLLKITSE